jgi:hypothetical protein
MSYWVLNVKAAGDSYEIRVGTDQAVAVKALDEARKVMGIHGTVTIAERLAVRGDSIVAIWIEERD